MIEPQSLSIPSDGETLSADLYLPDTPGPHPTVVMAGGWCYVKELAQPTYARAFAEAGLAAVVFDYRCFGDSTGEPRQHIDPAKQVADYRNTITFAEGLDAVDAERIGVWGISYSGGHVLQVGAEDSRVKALCGVVPVIDGYQNMRLAHGTIGFRRFQQALLDMRREQYRTGEVGYIEHQPAREGDLSTWPFPRSKETFRMLKDREAPNYLGRATWESSELLLGYHVGPYLRRLVGKPVKLVIAEGDDHTHWDLAVDAFGQIPGEAKELTIVPKSDHLTLYTDRQAQQGVASDIASFFSRSL
ncbi:hypothetical protein BVC93_16570 [Mycobacterium sp. MS1601]|uniref:alpha/beta hydrolase n=1 Tax=Mycobacterium sp. MS1601 TaxID=1936029 RepID=UPI0009790AD2|nr:alpha/beta fold hydrolase [Mycobacterium sp. MS1601]AQA03773.1 hypothetical protein BVC93_16570 [Mycobacterium sp. MS1601]